MRIKRNTKIFQEQRPVFFQEDIFSNSESLEKKDNQSFFKKIASSRVQNDIAIEKRQSFNWLVKKYGLIKVIFSAIFKIQFITNDGIKIEFDEISDCKKEAISIVINKCELIPVEKYSAWFIDAENSSITAFKKNRKYKEYKAYFYFDKDEKIKELINFQKQKNGKTSKKIVNFFGNGIMQNSETFYSSSLPKDISKSLEIFDLSGNLISKTNEYASNNDQNPLPEWPTKESFKYQEEKLIEDSKQYSMNNVIGGISKFTRIFYEDTGTVKIISKKINNTELGSLSKTNQYFDKQGNDLGIENEYLSFNAEKVVTRKIEIFGKNKITTIKKIEFRENIKNREDWTKKVYFYSKSGIRLLAIVRIYGKKHIKHNKATIEYFDEFGEKKGAIVPYNPKSPENKDFQVEIPT